MSHPSPILRPRPWLLLVSLTLLNLLGFTDRYLLLSFSPDIIADLHLSLFEFTLLTGFVFTLPYSVFGIIAGMWVDRFQRPRLIAGGLFVWSLLTAVTGAVGSFATMALARSFIGVGEAVLTPSALTLISDYFPQARRSFAIGIYYLALPLGIGASFLLAAAVGDALGWRGAFLLMGALGILACAGVLRMSDPLRHKPSSLEPPVALRYSDSLKRLLGFARNTPAFPLIVLGIVACGFVQGASVLDLVWWIRERGFAEAHAQRLAGLLLLGGGVTGAVAGGIGADWCERKWRAGRLKFLLASLLAAAPLIAAYRLVDAGTLLFPTLGFIASMIGALIYGPAYAAVQDIVPSSLRGTASGFLVLCMSVAGVSAGAATVGALAELFRGWGLSQPISHALQAAQFAVLVAIPAFSAAIRYLPARR